MCSHSGLLDSVECRMDDLVCSFEDFVKKSLVIVSVALGAVVLMLVYVLKIVTDRTARSGPEVANVDIGLQHQNIDVKSEDKRNLVIEKYKEVPVSTHSMNTSPIASCCYENGVDNIGCSASSQTDSYFRIYNINRDFIKKYSSGGFLCKNTRDKLLFMTSFISVCCCDFFIGLILHVTLLFFSSIK
ncbi:hypothetical protein K1T71_007347 [Dendrolimus kikuchii]|uniref:Uncharacterized protein n=1 Tax=Dendrolimus kikuchii TaxID=765133 RepID=A0ACC1D083_9NEOP|nr:hypothetical protein K1T71_007347 [Dendrolimus kikuchii]